MVENLSITDLSRLVTVVSLQGYRRSQARVEQCSLSQLAILDLVGCYESEFAGVSSWTDKIAQHRQRNSGHLRKGGTAVN